VSGLDAVVAQGNSSYVWVAAVLYICKNKLNYFNIIQMVLNAFFYKITKECSHIVRNEFRILGCHERDDTTQKSIGKAKFTPAEGCATDKESD
jgi:hypothetical protein